MLAPMVTTGSHLEESRFEEAYQAMKFFSPADGVTGFVTGLSIRDPKGKREINQEEVARMRITAWWREWIEQEGSVSYPPGGERPERLIWPARACCQATVLWEIRNEGAA